MNVASLSLKSRDLRVGGKIHVWYELDEVEKKEKWWQPVESMLS